MNGPYRAERPLNEIIPPDRRKEHAAVFGIACMIIGALLFKVVGSLLEPRPTPPPMVGFGPSPPDLSTPPVLARAQVPSPRNELADDIGIVVGAQRRTVAARCFDNRPELTSQRVELTLNIGPSGNVLSANGDGHDAQLANCVATQAMGWHFPANESQTRVVLPFAFVRN